MKKYVRPKKTWEQYKWKPQCSVCRHMKTHKDFRDDIFSSSYFNPEARRSVTRINREFGGLFKEVSLYACLKRHHSNMNVREPSRVVDGKLIIDSRFKPTFEVIEAVGTTEHELGLDEFIRMGRVKLNRGELQITATTYLQAIKNKMDNDAKTKDRRADMLSDLFKGAAPKRDV